MIHIIDRHCVVVVAVIVLVVVMARWRYWQGIGLAIHRSWVRVLAGHHHIVALGKLLTPVSLCHQAV